MKKAFVIDRAVRFWVWCAMAGFGVLLASAAAERDSKNNNIITHEKMTFLNFSDEPIQVSWVNPNDHSDLHPEHLVMPFEMHISNTFSGHVFVYQWKGSQLVAHVRQSTDMVVDEGYDPTADPHFTSSIAPQIHVLGGFDQNETKTVVCGTTKGDIHIQIKPFWSPLGAARFLHLAHKSLRYFDGCALNRVVPGFLTQFGIGADYEQRSLFRHQAKRIHDDTHLDPPIHFRPGTMSYAGSGEHSRSNEVFIVMPDVSQKQLDFFGGENTWETPFGYVQPEDLGVVGSWYSYGDMTPWGDGPDPQIMYKVDGYEYLKNDFPKMDYIKGCAIVPEADRNDPAITSMSYAELAEHVFEDEEEEEEL